MKSFSDNVFQAYQVIEKDNGNSGIKGFDFIKLAKMLCVEYPAEILSGILTLLDKREEENVEFDEFLSGVKTILMYDNYFDEMENLFKQLDHHRNAKIKKVDLINAANKLRSNEAG